MNLPVIETTGLTIDAAADALVVHVEALRTSRRAAPREGRPVSPHWRAD